MGAALTDLSATVTEWFLPVISTVSTRFYNEGPLTLNLSGNNVDTALGTVRIFYLTR
jgi:hypothetical protein